MVSTSSALDTSEDRRTWAYFAYGETRMMIAYASWHLVEKPAFESQSLHLRTIERGRVCRMSVPTTESSAW